MKQKLNSKSRRVQICIGFRERFITQLRQRALVNELLDQKYARIVNESARALSISPSEVIASAIREKYADAV